MVMTATVDVAEVKAPAKTCFACEPLPPGHPDREGCVCGSPVGFHYAALVLARGPVELPARLEHLRQQIAMTAGARSHIDREAEFQDRWDRDHARDLRATAVRYARAEQRLRREVERLEHELRRSQSASAPTRRANTRRAPGRTPRPAGRRAAAQRQAAADGGGGGDGDPPSGDPDPAPAAGGPGPSTLSLKIVPVITGDGTFSRGRSMFSVRESASAATEASRLAFAARTRLAHAAVFAATFSGVPTAEPEHPGFVGAFVAISACHSSVITRYQQAALALTAGSENGHVRRYA